MDEGKDGISLAEFQDSVREHSSTHALVRSGKDQGEIIERFREYMSENGVLLEDIFRELDSNKSGFLEPSEVKAMVGMIPGLGYEEVLYIMAYLHEKGSAEAGGRLSFKQLQAAIL